MEKTIKIMREIGVPESHIEYLQNMEPSLRSLLWPKFEDDEHRRDYAERALKAQQKRQRIQKAEEDGYKCQIPLWLFGIAEGSETIYKTDTDRYELGEDNERTRTNIQKFAEKLLKTFASQTAEPKRFGEFITYKTDNLSMDEKISLLKDCKAISYRWQAEKLDFSISNYRESVNCAFDEMLQKMKDDTFFTIIDRGTFGDIPCNRNHFEIAFRTMETPDYFLSIYVESEKMPPLLEKYHLAPKN